jgi:membrane protease YdiL (CAAX protease family)
LVGIALGIVRARTGSTLATTYVHAAYNATFMLALILAEIAPPAAGV